MTIGFQVHQASYVVTISLKTVSPQNQTRKVIFWKKAQPTIFPTFHHTYKHKSPKQGSLLEREYSKAQNQKGHHPLKSHKQSNMNMNMICIHISTQSSKSHCMSLTDKGIKPFRYFLTYKLSQDSIEILFNKIRHRCGWNNNPMLCSSNMHCKESWDETALSHQKQGIAPLLKTHWHK